jgi:hypothetical protein
MASLVVNGDVLGPRYETKELPAQNGVDRGRHGRHRHRSVAAVFPSSVANVHSIADDGDRHPVRCEAEIVDHRLVPDRSDLFQPELAAKRLRGSELVLDFGTPGPGKPRPAQIALRSDGQ